MDKAILGKMHVVYVTYVADDDKRTMAYSNTGMVL